MYVAKLMVIKFGEFFMTKLQDVLMLLLFWFKPIIGSLEVSPIVLKPAELVVAFSKHQWAAVLIGMYTDQQY